MRVVLPSNASKNHFPDNTVAKFTVKLPDYLDFSSGTWECGLSEILFFKSWSNLGDECFITLQQHSGPVTRVSIPNGYYENMEELCNKINECLNQNLPTKSKDAVSCTFNKNTRVVHFLLDKENFFGGVFKFSPALENILGKMSNNNITQTAEQVKIALPDATLLQMYHMMVYSDIIQPTVVGDIETNLLRSVAVSVGNHWEVQCTTYNKIQYLPLSRKSFNTITIHIYTDYGEVVPFNGGRAVVTLDFQKRKQSVYTPI